MIMAGAGTVTESTINIRNISVKCGKCDTYQVLSGYSQRDDWNVYVYECENDVCETLESRTLVEVPAHLDEFAQRDPGWRGGAKHAGQGPEGELE